jgi:signal transduction histidine kinase
MRFRDYFQRQSRTFILLEVLLLLAAIGLLDANTGYELSMFAFYGVPILLAVWFLDKNTAFVVAVLSALLWWWADAAAGHQYSTRWMLYWNVGIRLFFFLFLVIGGHAMKSQRESFAARLEVLDRLRRLEREIVAIGEREQQRIGQDIHDGLCQHLVAVSFAAASLKEDLQIRALPEAAIAIEIEQLLQEAVGQARQIARGLAPVPMDEAGLIAALENLATTMSRLSGLECNFEWTGEMALLEAETAAHLYRITQEAVNNVLKHAGAKRMEITLSGHHGAMDLTIRDDGIGLPVNGQQTDGMGFRSMQYRARMIGAELTIQTEEDGGSSVTCRLQVAS